MTLPTFENYTPKHLSFSALNGYRMCGAQFKLQRVLQVEQRPGLAGLGGNAVHTATEWCDMGESAPYADQHLDPKDMFEVAWEQEVRKRKEQSPSFNLEDYTVTGKAAAKYGGKRGIEWWMDNGPAMVQRWIDWRENGWEIWETPEGRLAIETEIKFVLPNGTTILLFIDRIMVTPAGQLVVVDIKTGARTPDVPEQLGLYSVGIAAQWGEQYAPSWGYWWDANKGTHSQPLALGHYTADYFASVYDEAVAGINAGSFLARPANACFNWCGVSHLCPANPNASLS